MNKGKKIKDLREVINNNCFSNLEFEPFPRDELIEYFKENNIFNESFSDEKLEVYYEIYRFIQNDYETEYDLNIFNNIDITFNQIKNDILNKYSDEHKKLIINYHFIGKTLTEFIKSLGEEKYIDSKVENLINIYVDILENNKIEEDIIKYEMELPKNGSRDNWMNLISGTLELADGKTEKFIKESNKIKKIYKKEN